MDCDEIHPRCQYCVRRGHACTYPQIRQIFFVKPVVIAQSQTSVLDCSGRLGDSGLLPDMVGRPIPGHYMADMAGYGIPGQEMAGHIAGPPPDLLAAKVACNACVGHPDRVTQLETEVKQLRELLLSLSGSEDHHLETCNSMEEGAGYFHQQLNLAGSQEGAGIFGIGEGTDSLATCNSMEEGAGYFHQQLTIGEHPFNLAGSQEGAGIFCIGEGIDSYPFKANNTKDPGVESAQTQDMHRRLEELTEENERLKLLLVEQQGMKEELEWLGRENKAMKDKLQIISGLLNE
ncbi:hypothetical protein BGX38DRAFT_1142380 [Terfezia claveryi]|nr:hypothetical protein BGX38DRAFT_1142380 [Terfezia claveryi]